MDILTVAVFAAFILILVSGIVEIAIKRPQTFLEMMAGARAFAEQELEDAGKASPGAEPARAADGREGIAPPVDENRRRLAA